MQSAQFNFAYSAELPKTLIACVCSLLVKRGAWISLDTKDNNGDTPRSLGEGVEDDEAFAASLKALRLTSVRSALPGR